MEGVNLMAYNLCSGANSFDKKLYSSIPGSVEYQPKSVVYSRKQNLFLVIFELSGAANEVVLYKENTDTRLANSKDSTVKGQDAAFIGLDDSQFAILDSDKIGLALYLLPGMSSKELDDKNKAALEENPTADLAADPAPTSSVKGPVHFMF